MSELDKAEELEKALSSITKRFGAEAIGYGKVTEPVDCISSGSLLVDNMTVSGGFPVNRVTEVFGWEGSAKTTQCQLFIAEAQKRGPCAWLDLERTLEESWARSCGVDWDKLLISHVDTAEEAFEVIEALVRSKQIAAIVVDSVATLSPRREVEGDVGDGQFGSQANVISQAMRKLVTPLAISGCALVFVNQLRVAIGKWTPSPSITPETTSGGKALGYYASLRLRMNATEGKDGIEVTARQMKNKIGGRTRINGKPVQTQYLIGYDGKVDKSFELAQLVADIYQSGAWITVGDQKWQGKEKLAEALRSDPVLFDELMEKVRA